MTETEFITLVSRMREAQRIDAVAHSRQSQEQRRQLERQVDEEIKRIKAFTCPPAYQPSLFEEFNNTRR